MTYSSDVCMTDYDIHLRDESDISAPLVKVFGMPPPAGNWGFVRLQFDGSHQFTVYYLPKHTAPLAEMFESIARGLRATLPPKPEPAVVYGGRGLPDLAPFFHLNFVPSLHPSPLAPNLCRWCAGHLEMLRREKLEKETS